MIAVELDDLLFNNLVSDDSSDDEVRQQREQRPRRRHRPRVFRERTNPLEMYDDEEFRRRFRVTRQTFFGLYIVPKYYLGRANFFV